MQRIPPLPPAGLKKTVPFPIKLEKAKTYTLSLIKPPRLAAGSFINAIDFMYN
jgi:hypothetical protein